MDRKIKTGILGLGDNSQPMLQAADELDCFEIIAVADSDGELAKKTATQYSCAAFDDYRQFIIQNSLDALIVAASLHSCDEYLKAAIKKKFNILKLAPPARYFEEAAELVRLADEQEIIFAIANTNRFAGNAIALEQQLKAEQLTGPLLITASCPVYIEHTAPWQSDPKLAGGGILLHNCYQMIDVIVRNFGTPQQIYSLNTNAAADRQQRLYLTEDTAMVTMKFSDTAFANLTANKTLSPQKQSLKISAKGKVITLTDDEFVVRNDDGTVIEKKQYADDELCQTKLLLENFAMSILSPDENKLKTAGSDNLSNMAVIEAAYLSARTGFAEEPAKIMQMAHLELDNPADNTK